MQIYNPSCEKKPCKKVDRDRIGSRRPHGGADIRRKRSVYPDDLSGVSRRGIYLLRRAYSKRTYDRARKRIGANPAFEHIFSELYSVPDTIRKGYYKVKTL